MEMSETTTGRRRRVIAFLLAAALAPACVGGTEYVQTTFHPVTQFGSTLNRVFLNTFGWTMAILAVVLVLVITVVIRFRERPGRAHPRQIHGNTLIEIIWTLIPAAIVTFIAVPTVEAVFTTQRPPAADALEIEVVGHQWWWEFRYPAEGVVTANLFYVPVGREVHLRLASADVIHSFWLPRIGGKRDVLPSPRTAEGERARPNHLVFTVDSAGRYRGQCAEFCGEAHAIMAMYGTGVTSAEFDTWIASLRDAPAPPVTSAAAAAAPAQDANAAAPPAQETLEEQGRRVFLGKTCIACHAVANTAAKGAIGPNLTRLALRPTVGAGAAPMTRENLERWIRNPRDLKAGALMPGAQVSAGGFPATGLTDDEIRAIAAWLFSLK
jgi:cytochrome c oxidase subunit 2